jgi:uncharacterized protein YecT (DUF1311 family)
MSPALPQDGGGPEPQCDGNTREIVDCLSGRTADWDRRLNDTYQKLMQDLAPKRRDQLRAAQRLWIQYRDANCLYYGLGEGTIARIEAGECMHSMTQSRALELEGRN